MNGCGFLMCLKTERSSKCIWSVFEQADVGTLIKISSKPICSICQNINWDFLRCHSTPAVCRKVGAIYISNFDKYLLNGFSASLNIAFIWNPYMLQLKSKNKFENLLRNQLVLYDVYPSCNRMVVMKKVESHLQLWLDIF